MLPGLTSAIFVDRPSTDFCDGPGAVVSAAIFQDNGRFVDEEGYQTYVYLNDQGLGRRGKDAVLQTAAATTWPDEVPGLVLSVSIRTLSHVDQLLRDYTLKTENTFASRSPSLKTAGLTSRAILVIVTRWTQDEFAIGMSWVANQRHFLFTTEFVKSNFSPAVCHDNEIVRNLSDGVEGKSGSICFVRYIRSCWCQRFSQILVTLDIGQNKMALAAYPRPCETRL